MLYTMHVHSFFFQVKLQRKTVEEKKNEIVAIPELLDTLQIKGYVVTIDAMGTQTKIAEKFMKRMVE